MAVKSWGAMETKASRARFGTFELDLRLARLQGNGQPIFLQEQMFRVLEILIEHNGDPATREEIKKKLWPNDTIVEFDHGINAVIRKLRKALDDSAEQPKYIETIARRGYRLMVPVEWVGAEDSSAEESSAPDENSRSGSNSDALPKAKLQLGRLTGKVVSHYRVLEVIGGGGMGLVYHAEDLKLGRAVALKFLPEEVGDDPIARERFEREAHAVSALDHPNVCTVYDFDEFEGRPFIAMQLLRGQTLREYLAEGRYRLSQPEGLEVAIQIASGLEAAHEKGIIHRDIKPANIFITEKNVAKILDFGVAKVLQLSDPELEKGRGFSRADEALLQDRRGNQSPAGLIPPQSSNAAGAGAPKGAPLQSGTSAGAPAAAKETALTRTGMKLGTAGYMSPEQVRGEKLDARTDIFSFGLVLYEMATGQRAFTGETEATVQDAIVNQAPVPMRELNSTLPAKLVATIDKALEKDREQRYQSAAEMRRDLEQLRIGRRTSRRPRWTWLAAAALLIAVAAGGWSYWRSRNTVRLTDQDTIVLADFINTTSDSVFNDALNTALRVELEQTPFLNTLGPDKVRGTLRQMNHPENEKLTPTLARQVCLQTNSKVYLVGSIADIGNHYGIELRAVNCRTGQTFARTEKEAANRNEVVKVLGVAGNELRRELGEPRASLEKFSQPLDEATSASLEALQVLAEGLKLRVQEGDAAALPHFKQAVELDQNFAYAYVLLGACYLNFDETALMSLNVTKAFVLRNRASRRERFYIEAYYYSSVTGEDKELRTFAEWIRNYPRDSVPHRFLSVKLRVRGDYEAAAAEAREAVRLTPSAAGYFDVAFADIALNRLDEARAALREAQAHQVDDFLLREIRYYLAFLQGNQQEMREQLAGAMGKAGDEDRMLSMQSDTEAYRGRFKAARGFSSRAVHFAQGAIGPEAAATYRVMQALREAEVGNALRARQDVAEALALSKAKGVQKIAALALARAGETTQATYLADRLSQKWPLATILQDYELPSVRAAALLWEKSPLEAINMLKVAAQNELGGADIVYLYPIYIRGEAYLQAGQAAQAAAEFQKMLDHPGIVLNFVTGALAHLQLGRAQVMMGDKDAARKVVSGLSNAVEGCRSRHSHLPAG